MRSRRFSWYLVGASLLLSVAMAQASVIYDSPSSLFSAAGIQTGRLFRDGVPSDWSTVKAFPGLSGTGTQYGYETIPVNVGVYPFIQISFDDPGTRFFASAYLGSYDPLTKSLNYLGDAGASGNPFGGTRYFQVQVAANSLVQILLNEVGTLGSGEGEPFGLLVEGFYDTQYGETPPIPEPSTMLLVGAGGALLIVFRSRRPKA